MEPSKYQYSTSGKYLKVGRGDTSYSAYVPNPLPPELDFDAELVCALSDASIAIGKLDLGRLLPNPHLLISPFIHREAVLSSRIEGTQASITDLYAYEAGQLALPGMTAPPESDVREVLNYVYALQYGLRRLESLPLSLRFICELHDELMRGVRGDLATPGSFRASQNWIGRPGCTLNEATYVPPPAPEMLDCLSELEKYLHYGNTYPKLVRLALIHYQFEAIHPFLDGNGRIGRLLISLLLVSWGLLALPLLYLSAFFERNRYEYYDKLLSISERGEWREWLMFFLHGVEEQANDAVGRARQLQDLQSNWRRQLQSMPHVSARLLQLVDQLFKTPAITIPQVQVVLGVSYPTAQHYVEKLVKAGILKQVGEATQGRLFMAQDILRIVDEQNSLGALIKGFDQNL